MRRANLSLLAVLFTIFPIGSFAQSSGPPRAAIDITAEQVQAVLNHTPPSTDRQLRVVDMGTYQLAVGVVHRGPTGGATPAAAASPAAQFNCGEKAGANSGVSGISHDATTETYIITSGSGTLVTGGHIVNGTRSAPDNQVTTILNGPSCSGLIAGADVVRRVVKTGDIVIIPAKVPHGWTDIADHVTYLSVRPDPDKVLQSGYVHPAIKK